MSFVSHQELNCVAFLRLNGFSKQSCGRTFPLMTFIAIDCVGHRVGPLAFWSEKQECGRIYISQINHFGPW